MPVQQVGTVDGPVIAIANGFDSANGNEGTFNGGAKRKDSALSRALAAIFDAGGSTSLSFKTNPRYNVTGAITIGWFGCFTNFTNYQMLVSRSLSNGATHNPFQLYTDITTGKLNLFRANGGGFSSWICHDIIPTAGQFSAVFVTQDGELGFNPIDSAKFFVNGVKGTNVDQPSSNTTGKTSTNTEPLLVGARTDGVGTALGECSLLLVWDRVLDDVEIQNYTTNPWQVFRRIVKRYTLTSAPSASISVPVRKRRGRVLTQQPQSRNRIAPEYSDAYLAYTPYALDKGYFDTNDALPVYNHRYPPSWGNNAVIGPHLHGYFEDGGGNPEVPSQVYGPIGRALKFDGTGQLYNRDTALPANGLQPVDETLIVVCDLSSFATDQHIVGFSSGFFALNDYSRSINFNSTTGAIRASGVSASNGKLINSSFVPVLNVPFCVGVRFSSSGAVFVNGNNVGTGDLSHGWSYVLSLGNAAGGAGSPGESGWPMSGRIYGAWAFKRGMPDGELLNLTANPWQLVRTRRRLSSVASSASGAVSSFSYYDSLFFGGAL